MNEPWQIVRYLRLAEKVIRDQRVDGLGADASSKLSDIGGAMRGIRDDVMTLIELVRAWARGDYRDVPLKAVVTIVAGVLYFVTPIDFIPDFLFGFGLLDDVTVLTWVIGVVRGELDRFRNRPVPAVVMSTAMDAATPNAQRNHLPALPTAAGNVR
ncbi:MAG: DUF1232 domain-containing protein [Gammaproteobacteria bacterium]|nr:DUF1232 domain-containing protein [Gammaproteobacteria bacterium]